MAFNAFSAVGLLGDAQIIQWQPTGSLNQTREDHAATNLVDGRVRVVGGTSIVELFNATVGAWSLSGRLRDDGYGVKTTLMSDNTVLALTDNGSELYNPITKSTHECSL